MTHINKNIAALDWSGISDDLHCNGYAVVKKFLGGDDCKVMEDLYEKPSTYRKTVTMQRYRFGLGEYRYFDYPLPPMVDDLRQQLYSRLVPIANTWMKKLRIEQSFPEDHDELRRQCHAHNQTKPTPLLLKYQQGGFNTLHQDLYGEVYFPLQAVILLSDPKTDFSGGEFVMTQQVPRAQSRAVVLKPGQGDMIIFTTNFYPCLGARGYYRVNVKHGISEIHRGERYALGIILHDAAS